MTAEVCTMITAYCDECDWESEDFGSHAAAQGAADVHNAEYHGADQ